MKRSIRLWRGRYWLEPPIVCSLWSKLLINRVWPLLNLAHPKKRTEVIENEGECKSVLQGDQMIYVDA